MHNKHVQSWNHGIKNAHKTGDNWSYNNCEVVIVRLLNIGRNTVLVTTGKS